LELKILNTSFKWHRGVAPHATHCPSNVNDQLVGWLVLWARLKIKQAPAFSQCSLLPTPPSLENCLARRLHGELGTD